MAVVGVGGDDLPVLPDRRDISTFLVVLLDLKYGGEDDVVVEGVVERIGFTSVQPVLDNPEHVVIADDSSVVSCNPNPRHRIKAIRLRKEMII
jgi:hypothetical protein